MRTREKLIFLKNFPRRASVPAQLRYMKDAGAVVIVGWNAAVGTGSPWDCYAFLVVLDRVSYLFFEQMDRCDGEYFEMHVITDYAMFPRIKSDGAIEFVPPDELKKVFREFLHRCREAL
jgi:hypothetical protein